MRMAWRSYLTVCQAQTLLSRANFAQEPVIRGLSGGQIGLVIDGMPVIGACVDKMDPSTSYVEADNLQRLELSKGGFDLTNSFANWWDHKPGYRKAQF